MSNATEGDVVRVEIPGYRPDLEREVDLIEEVVRVQGYEHVGSSLPPVRQAGGLPERYAFLGRIRRSLVRAGLREVRQIPFVSDADLKLVGDRDAVRVTNPLQPDDAWLRTRLLPGLLEAAGRNARRGVRSVAIFEVSNVFRLETDGPRESPAVGIVLTGLADEGWSGSERAHDVFDAKGIVEELLDGLRIEWKLGESPGPPLHPGRSASVRAGGEAIGAFGEIQPDVAEAFDISGRVAVAELDVAGLMRLARDTFEVRDASRFPPVRRDLAFVVGAATPAGDVHAALEDAAGALLGSATIFDVHIGPPLPEGKKSLAFSVDFRAPDRTLTDAEAHEAVAAIVDRLTREFGAELRSG
jgi:phenylalanyl-tRNA synthetase beta chain